MSARRTPGLAGRSLLPTLATMAACLAVAFMATAWITHGFRTFTSEDARRLAVAERPVALSPLRVVTAQGAVREPWSGDPAARAWLVTFFYSRCLAICLSTGSEFQQLQQAMRARGTRGVRLASVSFDRAHDTAAALQGYAHRFGADPSRWLVAVPESDAGLARLLSETGVVAIDDGLGGYAHNAAIHVIVPPGRLVAIFGMDRYREALAFAERLPG